MENKAEINNITFWNQKILNEISIIKNERPELLKYIDELEVTIPDEANPEITALNLKKYYESLLVLLCRYDQVS